MSNKTNPYLPPSESVDDRNMTRLLRILRNTDQSELSYIWRAWLIDDIGSWLSVFFIWQMIHLPYFPLELRHPIYEEPLMSKFFWSVIWAPLEETLIMWPVLVMLIWLLQRSFLVALVSAALWGLYHSVYDPWHGLAVFWGFFVMSVCFLEWQKKSASKAVLVTAAIHALHNAVGFVVILISTINVS